MLSNTPKGEHPDTMLQYMGGTCECPFIHCKGKPVNKPKLMYIVNTFLPYVATSSSSIPTN